MLVNDSIGFIHYFSSRYNPFKKRKKTFGKKIEGHQTYLDFKNANYYEERNTVGLPKYLVKKTCADTMVWAIQKNTYKLIKGYKCILALAVNDKNDSTLVYFTNELKFKKGFLFYEGIPGIVLEAYDQRYGEGQHYEVTNIEEIEVALVAPKCTNFIGCKEYSEIIIKRKEKREGN